MSSLKCGRPFSQIALLSLALVFVGCYSTGPEVPIGPDTKHDLVIFFKRDATHDQIENFYTGDLSYSWCGDRYPLPAISEYLRLFPVDGYEAIALKFFRNASQADRDTVKSRVRASALVHKVFQDVVPQDIKHVD
jgi:hypothetical protein